VHKVWCNILFTSLKIWYKVQVTVTSYYKSDKMAGNTQCYLLEREIKRHIFYFMAVVSPAFIKILNWDHEKQRKSGIVKTKKERHLHTWSKGTGILPWTSGKYFAFVECFTINNFITTCSAGCLFCYPMQCCYCGKWTLNCNNKVTWLILADMLWCDLQGVIVILKPSARERPILPLSPYIYGSFSKSCC